MKNFRSSSIKFILSSVLILLIFSFLFFKIVNEWDSLSGIKCWNHPVFILIHLGFLILTFISFTFGWFLTLKINNQRVAYHKSSYIWLVSNLGKYIPGKIFMFAGRTMMSKMIGVRKTECISAMTLEHFYMLLATFPFLIILVDKGHYFNSLGSWAIFFPVVFVGIVFFLKPQLFFDMFNRFLVKAGQEEIDASPSLQHNFFIVINYLIGWSFYGLSGVVLLYAFEFGNYISIFSVMSVFIASWMIGFASLLTPGGLGVREGIIVLLLRPEIQTSEAILIALTARMTWTVIEMTGVVIGLFLGKLIVKSPV